jgi:hypothetical protein
LPLTYHSSLFTRQTVGKSLNLVYNAFVGAGSRGKLIFAKHGRPMMAEV